MNNFSFDETIKQFDLIVSCMNDANKKNNTMFRKICKEIFQKSYSKLKSKNDLTIGSKILGVGIASVIKMANKQYERGSFEKSVQKLNHQDSIPSYFDMVQFYRVLENSAFFMLLKLLKTQNDYGLIQSVHYSQKFNA